MGNNLYGNGNGHYSHGNQFPSVDTVLTLCNSTVYCKLIMVIFSTTVLFFWFLYYKNAHMLLLASVAYLGLSLPKPKIVCAASM